MLELDIQTEDVELFFFCSVPMFFPEHSKIEKYRQRTGSVTNRITHGLDGYMVWSHGFYSFPENIWGCRCCIPSCFPVRLFQNEQYKSNLNRPHVHQFTVF